MKKKSCDFFFHVKPNFYFLGVVQICHCTAVVKMLITEFCFDCSISLLNPILYPLLLSEGALEVELTSFVFYGILIEKL